MKKLSIAVIIAILSGISQSTGEPVMNEIRDVRQAEFELNIKFSLGVKRISRVRK